MSNTTPYILVKDGEYLCFPSEGAACEYLGVVPCSIASAWRGSQHCRGHKVIRARSERSLYMDKRLWKIWSSMHERCELKSHAHFKHYGGRGICVCDEWGDYLPFAKWARKNGYSEGLTIDRIDVNGNYEPNNCRWVTMKEQQNKRRNNHVVEYKGEQYTLSQLAEKTGIGKTTLRERLKLGWSIEDTVEKPVRKRTRGWRPSGQAMDGKEEPQTDCQWK